MRFYRSEVLVTCKEWSKDMKNGRMVREQLRRIAAKGEPFNQKIKHSAFFFVADADEEAVILGIIWKGDGTAGSPKRLFTSHTCFSRQNVGF